MRAQRLRAPYDVDQLARIYAEPYNSDRWPEHQLRIRVTAAIGNAMVDAFHDRVGADLSCGDGSLLRLLNLTERHFGDLMLSEDAIYAPPYTTSLCIQYKGFIENTIHRIPPVDVFVMTETLEHLNYPDDMLMAIGEKSRRLVLSTPIEAWGDSNPEHYWAWDREYVSMMIQEAGFCNTATFAVLDCRSNGQGYQFGIWGCSK